MLFVRRTGSVLTTAAGLLLASLAAPHGHAQQAPNAAEVIRMVDNAVRMRVEDVASFTDIEHYVVYRGDPLQAVAEMTVRDSYTKGKGKTYTVLSQSGSEIVFRFGLKPLLDNETAIDEPEKVARSWFTSANYAMTLKGGEQRVNGRACYALAIKPMQKAPNLLDGTIWVDAKDGTLVKVEGIASKSPSPFAGTTHMMREYRNIDGYAMATHARAESKSFWFGRTVVTIDYSDYRLQVHPATSEGR